MNHFVLILLLILINVFDLQSQCVLTPNFNDWVDEGDSAASWSVISSGTQCFQNSNTWFPSMFVGPDTLINVHISGKFRVNTNADDDYIGFVFGYQTPVNFGWMGTPGFNNPNTADLEFYLFDWKKNYQNYSNYVAQEGFSLNKVDGNFYGTIPTVFPSFWSHTTSASFDVLQTQYSNTAGWASYTTYDFDLYYASTRAVILIDSDTVFNEPGCFEPGRFGFYGFSQSGALYWDFNYELYIDFAMEAQNVCLGDTMEFFFIDTGTCYNTNTYTNLDTFWWDLGDGTISVDTNPVHLYDSAGAYNVALVATDINGCTDTAGKVIYIHDKPSAEIAVDDVCEGDSAFFADSTSLPYGSITAWDWDFGDGSSNGTSGFPIHMYNQSGYYTVQLAVEDNAGCVDTTDSVIQIFANPVPQFDIEDACDGLAVVLIDSSIPALSSIINLEWDVENNGSIDYTTDTVNHVYGTHGQYAVQLIVYDSLGCRDSLTQLTTVYPMPDADFEVPSVCFKENSLFQDSSTVATGYLTGWDWDFGDGSSSTNSTPQYQFQTSGQQAVELKVTSDGACQDSLTKNITVYYLPVSVFETPPNCENLPVNYIQNSTSQSGSIVQYEWAFGDGNGSQTSGPMHDYNGPGIYPVTLEVTTQFGCKDTALDSIRIYPAPQAAFNWENNVCEGDELPIYDQSNIQQSTPGGDQIMSWDWDVNGTALNIQNPTYVTSISEKINVFLLVTSNYGCVDSTRNYPEIFPIPDAKFKQDMACSGLPSKFTDLSTISSGLVDTWSWSFGDANTADSTDPTNVYTLPGTYKVNLEVWSNKGCYNTTEHDVVIPMTPVVKFDVSPKSGCSPLTPRAINLSSIVDGELTYKWKVNGKAYSDEISPKLYLDNDTLETVFFDLKLIATSDKGCITSLEKPEIISVYPRPIAEFAFDKQGLDLFDPVMLFENRSENSVRWKWKFDDGKTSTDFAPAHEYLASGKYTVHMTAWNEYNCLDTAVHVIDLDPVTTLYIPNSFTPNGDGNNDVWNLRGFNEGNRFEIRIWDRWGHLVTQSADMSFSWDGKSKDNKVLPNGVYAYDILFQTSDGEYKEIHGSLSLLR
tara:strand:+ start:3568 stop:6837 length:3270 start_codon:yes stop_codon:yes gene_type:complete